MVYLHPWLAGIIVRQMSNRLSSAAMFHTFRIGLLKTLSILSLASTFHLPEIANLQLWPFALHHTVYL